MKMFYRQGFTIIELLTTIAIIGILAAVILTSLNDARVSGIEAKIKTEMDAITKRATIDNNRLFTYDFVCGSNGVPPSTVIGDIITSINTLASSTVTCNSSPTAYALSVPVGTVHWCVDSAGVRKEIPDALDTTAGSEEFACP